jgi:hypothetical protein
MSRIRASFAFVAAVCLFFSCSLHDEVVTPQQIEPTDQSIEASARIGSILRYVSTSGSDTYGDGSSGKPWRTIRYAVTKVPSNSGYILKLSAGTFVESGMISVPAGVSIEGAGMDVTYVKAASSFYYYPSNPGYANSKFLLSFSSSYSTYGNQSLGHLTVDGDERKLHGGVMVRYRTGVIIENIKVQRVNYCGIWLWDTKDSQLNNSKIIDSSWGTASYCSGALSVSNLERVTVNNLYINENRGYGIKGMGSSPNRLTSFKIRNSHVTVNPYGLWDSGKAPNIAIEFWQAKLSGCEISGTYVDNTISLVTNGVEAATGVIAMRIHHNTFDMAGRSAGTGYSIELTMNDVEIDYNYFNKGKWGIANWQDLRSNWRIHHNTFYQIEASSTVSDIVRSQKSGMSLVRFYNNTIEMAGTRTTNVIGIYAGKGQSVYLKNNLIVNNNTSYAYYPNRFLNLENGAYMSDFQVLNNCLYRLPMSKVSGTYSKNILTDPQLQKVGNRPNPYYVPMSGSPLINAGINVGYSFLGLAPTIGAHEAL